MLSRWGEDRREAVRQGVHKFPHDLIGSTIKDWHHPATDPPPIVLWLMVGWGCGWDNDAKEWVHGLYGVRDAEKKIGYTIGEVGCTIVGCIILAQE